MEEALQLYMEKIQEADSKVKCDYSHISFFDESLAKKLGLFLFREFNCWRGGGAAFSVYLGDDHRYVIDCLVSGGCPDYGCDLWEKKNTVYYDTLAEVFDVIKCYYYDGPIRSGEFFDKAWKRYLTKYTNCREVGPFPRPEPLNLVKEKDNQKFIEIIREMASDPSNISGWW